MVCRCIAEGPRLLNTSAYPRHRTRNPLDPAVELTFRDFYCLHNGIYENLQVGTSLKTNKTLKKIPSTPIQYKY